MRFRLASILLLALVVLAQAAGPGTLTQHNESPLISFRILFHTGAASDPAGKEGVAALTADATGSDEALAEGLLHRADLALYEAKRQGRNRVVALESDGEMIPAG